MAPASPDPTATIVSVSDRLIKALPPAFILLIIMNILFMGALAYSVQHNAEARNEMLARIIDRCLIAPK
jgi:hypothetical protein